ncbi:MAG TPA: hypothetical protein VK855_12080 [Thioalkalivibrio sp.]|nr:hypothetical protein [Thioalkalivibrio sp.]
MTNMKEKLAASVREAKAAQAPETAAAEKNPPTKPVARPKAAATKAKPAARKTATSARKSTPATRGTRAAAARKEPSSEGIPESGTALFPERVWPD